ncbi:MAG: hypothetical protein RL094_800 [Candidatus Parcubacteria bacterium]|jgi:hypothetical protein
MKKLAILLCSAVLVFNLVPVLAHADDKDDDEAEFWANLSESYKAQNYGLTQQINALKAQSAAYVKILNKTSPTLRLLSPKANQKFVSSSTLNLTWQGINLSGSTIDAELISQTNPSQPISLKTAMVNDGQESVVIPGVIAGGKYQVRLKATSAPTVMSTSRGFFTISATSSVSQTITFVAQPVNTTLGATTSVWWRTVGNVPRIEAFLYRDSTLVKKFPDYQNTGYFEYKVPFTQPVGTGYKFVIQPKGNPAAAATSSTFSITADRGVSDVTLSGASIAQGGEQTLSLQVRGGTKYLDVYLMKGLTNPTQTLVKNNVAVNTGTDPRSVTVKYTIPRNTALGNDYYFKVSDYQNSGVSGTSTTFSVVNQVIAITTQPLNVTLGQKVAFNWSTQGYVPRVNIDLYKGNTIVRQFANQANDNKFEFAIPVGYAAGTDYKFVVTNSADTTAVATTSAFSITTSRQFVSTNLSAASVAQKGTIRVNWSSVLVNNVRVELLQNGVVKRTIDSSVPASQGEAGLSVTLAASDIPGAYAFRLTDTQNTSVATTTAAFTVTGQSFTITAQPAASVALQNPVTISWTNTGSIPRVKVRIVRDGASADLHSAVVTNGTNGQGTTYSYVIPASFTVGANTKIVIEDAAASTVAATSSAFTVTTSRSISNVTVSPTVLTRGSTSGAVQWVPTLSTRFYLQLLRDGAVVPQTSTNGLTSAAGLSGLIKIGTKTVFTASDSGVQYKPDAQLATSTNYSIRVYDADNTSVSATSPIFQIK